MEKVILIAGMLNSCGRVFYWKDELAGKSFPLLIEDYGIGDYAIVENENGYDLIKIIGFVETTKDKVCKFANYKYENVKKFVKALKKEEVEQNCK